MAIVAETWPEETRAKTASILQFVWTVGFFLAATFDLTLKKTYGWRGLSQGFASTRDVS
ncbi:MAG: MFS transporter [Nitrospiraceae bacterium]